MCIRDSPSTDDLQLPDVPENLRPEARRVLGSALPLMFHRGIGIKAGTCWLVAQGLTAVANGEIGYVEGCWTRSSTNPWHGTDDDTDIAAHAWNSYRGHSIDLIAEFYAWRSSGEDSPWLHEPLKEYFLEELRGLDYFDETIDSCSDYGDISSCVLVPHESLPEHLKNEPDFGVRETFNHKLFDEYMKELNEYTERIAFRPARDRLLARINSTTQAAAA